MCTAVSEPALAALLTLPAVPTAATFTVLRPEVFMANLIRRLAITGQIIFSRTIRPDRHRRRGAQCRASDREIHDAGPNPTSENRRRRSINQPRNRATARSAGV